MAEMTPVAVLLSGVVLLPRSLRSVTILSSGLEILPIINLLNQSESFFIYFLGPKVVCNNSFDWFDLTSKYYKENRKINICGKF